MRSVAIVFALMVVAATATSNLAHSSTTKQKIQDLVQDKKWASIIMNLAELHLMAQGPIDTLVSAIQDVIADLEAKQVRSQEEYDQRSSEHDSEVRRLNDEITNALSIIANTEELIANILVPQSEQLNSEIANLNKRVEDDNNHIDSATQERDNAHNEFLQRVDEHNSALEAVSEALGLLNQISEGDASLVQINKSKKSLEKVHAHLKGKSVEAALIEALVSITTEQFSNSESLDKVFELLNQIQENLSQSLIDENNNEEASVKSFNEDMRATKQDIQESLALLAERTQQLEYNQEQISEGNDLIDQKKADQIQFQNDLTAEEESFARATEAYNELVAEYQSESDACNEALDVIQDANLAEYIQGRVDNESGVIDQSVGGRHGLNN